MFPLFPHPPVYPFSFFSLSLFLLSLPFLPYTLVFPSTSLPLFPRLLFNPLLSLFPLSFLYPSFLFYTFFFFIFYLFPLFFLFSVTRLFSFSCLLSPFLPPSLLLFVLFKHSPSSLLSTAATFHFPTFLPSSPSLPLQFLGGSSTDVRSYFISPRY